MSKGKLYFKYRFLVKYKYAHACSNKLFCTMQKCIKSGATFTFILHLFFKRSKYAKCIHSCQYLPAKENII
jgi:hypothetical protein